MIGRPKPGLPLADATRRLDALAQNPDWQPRQKFTGERLPVRLSLGSAATGLTELRKQFSQPLFIVMALVGIVCSSRVQIRATWCSRDRQPGDPNLPCAWPLGRRVPG